MASLHVILFGFENRYCSRCKNIINAHGEVVPAPPAPVPSFVESCETIVDMAELPIKLFRLGRSLLRGRRFAR
ncbi:MAG: hypothetical protein A3F53_00845 [Candidatus Zambryskibacteria bacterium RIFCSPHIGHO2_12_FULL_48_10]|uniref:Uncharacterized protein n=1 Tax=Candidatus Zambryskibacteria bacterium RIFCSPHIGHO2_01_FULL_46_25 TaxID=1802738 RepID=A0A1G2SZR6_9BACT|nr:MAG: hypothetical protein A2838_01375 [Candidatus Zambryskibacteria bacterium RIFCSPHIGHO2_01_FULL_46_25]OHB02607.1 MAG: hypothetical protein A3F53_00845 [Candidatus Zambryskibacteria bacterium RIFCSPHIGHO2_12_FULL_48_10]OHB06775.1 MAG: hypothetical protein A3A31_00510 [Candidatus Zambryskibacteria bacterium RIFCSPLOWO2_01_FULL_48_25]